MGPAARLAKLVRADGCTVAPGAFDAWSARLIEQAGFDACYMTGFGAAASLLGAPDIGLLGAGQMADQAARVADAVDVPVIADGDTGYGNLLNLRHAVRAYRRAGVAAIQIEDQTFPKRCGHLDGKQVIPAAEMVAKDAAGDALLVIARTDARATDGLDAALDRGRAFAEAGADLLFIEAPRTREELAAVAAAFPDMPLVANMVEGGRTPYLGAPALADIGFALALFPITPLLAATRAIQTTLRGLARDGAAQPNALPGFADLHRVSGLDDYLAYAQRMEEET